MELIGKNLYRTDASSFVGIGNLAIVNITDFPHVAWRALKLREIEHYEPWTKINRELLNSIRIAKSMQ